jgi:uncharacterized HAD superfamily protein
MNTDRLIDEIQQIKAQFEAEVTGKRKQWPKAIKDRVLALLASEMKLQAVAKRTGISHHTIAYWCSQEREPFQEVSVVEAPPKALTVTKKPVTVTVSEKPATVKKSKAPLKIKTPDGFLIEARDAKDALKILRGLRRDG